LKGTLDALVSQFHLDGEPLAWDSYEILLLLNNCTDASAEVAREYGRRHPGLHLHVAERTFHEDEAHVGTARRMLMDAACARMERVAQGESGVILSTDADTLVAPDWIAANLAAIEGGAEVVGGEICLLPQDVEALDAGTRDAYENDQRFQHLVARLESLLDPDPSDPWPRHLHHFGASLACTCEAYRRCGGLPAVKPLEDVAFIDALRKVGARIRHAPEVRIYTSARLEGRAEVGLSGQLRHWQREAREGIPHVVDSCEWLLHRFSVLAALRRFNDSASGDLPVRLSESWSKRLADARALRLPTPRFLEQLDCNALIEESFESPVRRAEISDVLRGLAASISRLQAAPEHQA
jgi:GT2 family glycosyltransferase